MKFTQGSYEEARGYAREILKNSQAIDDIFKKFDSIMNQMYSSGGAWESSGATQAEEAFQSDFHSRFEPFVNDVVSMNELINSSSEEYSSTDNSSNRTITSV